MEKIDWDRVWKVEKRVKIRRYLALHIALERIFKKYFPEGNGKIKILEIGCAPGRWLVYFYRRFGYEIHGIDDSLIGVRKTEQMLTSLNIKGKIYHNDLFAPNIPTESFDIVYSMGLLEHFEDPLSVVNRHITFAKRRGVVFISVPNYSSVSFYRFLAKLIGQVSVSSITEGHNLNVMNLNWLKENIIERLDNAEVLFLNYFGPIKLTIVPTRIGHNLLLMLPVHLIDQLLGVLTFFLHSAIFSPFLVLVLRKK